MGQLHSRGKENIHQEMAQTLEDLLILPNIVSNYSGSHSLVYVHESNNTNLTVLPSDEIDYLRYGMTTTVILM